MNQKKSYNELIKIESFEERLNYLRCSGKVGEDTFGYQRYLNQKFYTSPEWRNFRNRIIVRDNGCDMALEDHPIPDGEIIHIHHINPVTVTDILDRNPMLFDENNVVCVRDSTHKAIHYGDLKTLGYTGLKDERTPNDMCPWKLQKKGEQTAKS